MSATPSRRSDLTLFKGPRIKACAREMWGGFSSSDWFQAGSKIKTLNSPLTHSGYELIRRGSLACMRSMHIIFPKGQTIEGKEERGEEEAPTTAATATQHRTHSCTPTHSLTVSRTRTQRPRPPFRSRRTCKIVRPLARPRTTTHQQQEGAGEDGPLFGASPVSRIL